MADAGDSKSPDRKVMSVRPRPPAPRSPSGTRGSVLEAVLFDLVVDRLERELQQLGGLALVAAGELERLRDQAALDVGERVADRDPDDRGLAAAQLRARQGTRRAPSGRPSGRCDSSERRAARRTTSLSSWVLPGQSCAESASRASASKDSAGSRSSRKCRASIDDVALALAQGRQVDDVLSDERLDERPQQAPALERVARVLVDAPR